EVNEASTIIQNAAHEDCNIIFGAVQDERMGDEVKITVIATGFKQDMPERRARMMAESLMPAADYEVPIRSQGVGARGRGAEAPALFASEERELRQTGRLPEATQAPRIEAVAEPGVESNPERRLDFEDEAEVDVESDGPVETMEAEEQGPTRHSGPEL